jgi:hypothetical protein
MKKQNGRTVTSGGYGLTPPQEPTPAQDSPPLSMGQLREQRLREVQSANAEAEAHYHAMRESTVVEDGTNATHPAIRDYIQNRGARRKDVQRGFLGPDLPADYNERERSTWHRRR